MLVIWCKQLVHWKSPWCWERLRAEGEEGVRGWGGWMASLMQWTRTWANFGRWWGTGRPGLLQSMGHKESDPTAVQPAVTPFTTRWGLLHGETGKAGFIHTRASPEPISLWTMPIKSGIVLIFFRHHQLNRSGQSETGNSGDCLCSI